MFDRGSRPSIIELVIQSADSGIESADSTADSATNPLKIGRWVWAFSIKPIFHQNTKYLGSGAGVGQCPRRQNFTLGIPTCWYLKCENLRYPMPNPRRQT